MSGLSVDSNKISVPKLSNRNAYTKPTDNFSIEIRDPITHDVNGKKFTDFALITKTNMSIFKFQEASVRRRYSDFEWLKNSISRDVLDVSQFDFPGKGYFQQLPFRGDNGIFEDSFIEARRQKLEKFMNSIGHHPMIKRETIFHMFLTQPVVDKNHVTRTMNDY